MKIFMPCLECMKTRSLPEIVNYVEVRDDGVYEIECTNGHRRSAILQHTKFELLFEFAAMALLDGYTREAVTSFAVSLERFYEYWIRATFFANGTKPEVTEETWKLIAASSERQLGAFCMLYLREHARAPAVLPNRSVEFRNKVIHKGYIPSRSQVVEYASEVLAIIVALYSELIKTHRESVNQMVGFEIKNTVSRIGDPRKVNITAIRTMVADILSSDGRVSFEDGLSELEARGRGVFSK
jgi:hypothetical protein